MLLVSDGCPPPLQDPDVTVPRASPGGVPIRHQHQAGMAGQGIDVLQDGDSSVTCSPWVSWCCLSRNAVPRPTEHGRCCGTGAGIPCFSPGRRFGTQCRQQPEAFMVLTTTAAALPPPIHHRPQQIPGSIKGKPGSSARQQGIAGEWWAGRETRFSLPFLLPLLLCCSWHLWSGMF